MHTISELMTPGPMLIDREQSLAEATRRMEQLAVHHLPVIASHSVVGMLSEADLLRFERGKPARDPELILVGEAMSGEFLTVPPSTPAAEVAQAMRDRRLDAAVVVDGGRIVGVFTNSDALRAVAERRAADEPQRAAWPHKILCPIDFSAGSRDAVSVAVGLARSSGGELTLLHAYGLRIADIGDGVAVSTETLERLERETDAALHDWQRELHAPGGPAISIAQGLGSEREVIVRHARDHAFDLIVIGTHGRTGVKRMLLGSVAEDVTRHAPCPVLAVRRRD